MTRAGSKSFRYSMLFKYDGLYYLGEYGVAGKLTYITPVEGGLDVSTEAVWAYASRMPETYK